MGTLDGGPIKTVSEGVQNQSFVFDNLEPVNIFGSNG